MNLLDMRNRRELVKVLHHSNEREMDFKMADGGMWTSVRPGSTQDMIVKRVKRVSPMHGVSRLQTEEKHYSMIEEEYSQKSFDRLSTADQGPTNFKIVGSPSIE